MKTIHHIIKDRDVYFVRKDQTVLEAVKYMAEKQVGAVAVLDGDRLMGVFSERDLMTRIVVQGKDPAKTLVGEVMSTNLVIAEPDESYESCLAKMKQARCRHLPVVSAGKLVGFLSQRALLETDIDEKNYEIKRLHEYIYYVPRDSAGA